MARLTSAEQWRRAVEAVRKASPRHGKSLAFGRLQRLGKEEVAIAFTKEADFHRATVGGTGKAIVEKALSEHFGRPLRLTVEVGVPSDSLAPSIAEEEHQQRQERERSVDARVRKHPAVQSALRILGGELEHVLVLERERPSVQAEEPDEGA